MPLYPIDEDDAGIYKTCDTNTEVVLNLPRIPNLVYLLSTTQNSSHGIPVVEVWSEALTSGQPFVKVGKIIELENAEYPGKCLVLERKG